MIRTSGDRAHERRGSSWSVNGDGRDHATSGYPGPEVPADGIGLWGVSQEALTISMVATDQPADAALVIGGVGCCDGFGDRAVTPG